MAKTARIKWLPQKMACWGLVISGLTEQKILKFDWSVVIDVDYIIIKEFSIFKILVNLFIAQKRLELGRQIPTLFSSQAHITLNELNNPFHSKK